MSPLNMGTAEDLSASFDRFDIFNDRYFAQESSSSRLAGASSVSTFPLWLRLPKELRLKIWTCHLGQRRYLRVLLEEETNLSTSPGIEQEPEEHEQGSAVSSEQLECEGQGERETLLRVTFLDKPKAWMSVLQLVCRESYEAYMSFYSIRLPAVIRVSRHPGSWPGGGYDFENIRILAHIHPDLDILSIQASHAPEIIKWNLLPLFLHTLVQCDFSPAGVRFGIRNLCVDLVHLSGGYALDANDEDDEDDMNIPPSAILASVRLTVSHLRNLYLRLVTGHLEPRTTTGPLTGSGAQPWYNASMPIIPDPLWGWSGTVEAVEGVDPRLAQPEGVADLHQVWIGYHIRPSLDVWAEQERAWGVRAGAEVADGLRVRALVGLDAQSASIISYYHLSLKEAMREESTHWLSCLDPDTDNGMLHREMFERAQQNFLPGSADEPPVALTPEEWIIRRRPHTAVGFWLVEPEALEAAKTTERIGKGVADLSETGKDAIELWVMKESCKRQ